MRRRLPLVLRLSQMHFHVSGPRSVFLSAALALLLSCATAVQAQDTTPPAPPPDQQGTPLAEGQSTVRAVRISDVEGMVQVYQGDEVAFEQAQPNMPAVEGMRFVTGDNGRLEIQFEDGSVARVTPDSSIRLTLLRRNSDGSTVTQVDALAGLSYYELNSRGGQYSVHFGPDTATPVKDAVFRVGLDSEPYQLAVMHGAVHVDDGQVISLDVHPSQTFQLDPGQPGEYTVAENLAADSWDQWNSDRDHVLAEMATSMSAARASSGNPNNPAWNDLDYYGNWYNLPGYGQVWSPAGVGQGWDPFGNGAWGYYPSFGYTWISGYPWGWWPYHCGAWDFLDGYGWVWIPGNCGWGFYGSGWYPYSTVWGVPPHYICPPRPHMPVRGGPRHPVRLITVNRGEQYAAPFRFDHVSRPVPRPLAFQGKTFTPLEPGIHPLQRGPLGESFTTALERSHPEMVPSTLRNPAFRGTYTPPAGTRTFGAPPNLGTPHIEGGFNGGPRGGFNPGGAPRGSFSNGGGAPRGGYSGGGGMNRGGGSPAPAGGGHVGGAAPAPSSGGSPHH